MGKRTGNRTTVQIVHASSGRVLCAAAVVADTFFSRLVGLLGSKGLGEGEGLWIVPTRSVHTVGMRFPIDVVLLDHAGRVVELRSGMRGWQCAGLRTRAYCALELPAGSIQAYGLDLGEILIARAR